MSYRGFNVLSSRLLIPLLQIHDNVTSFSLYLTRGWVWSNVARNAASLSDC